MARYNYRCTSCGSVFEVTHGMLEHPEVTCPTCGAPALRVFEPSGIVLKGSGFYNTDQRGKGSSAKAKASTPAKSEPAAEKAPKPAGDKAATPAKSEAKPAAPAPAAD